MSDLGIETEEDSEDKLEMRPTQRTRSLSFRRIGWQGAMSVINLVKKQCP